MRKLLFALLAAKAALACCSLAPAHFSKTLGLAAEIQKDGQIYHLLGYQNTAVNLNAGGANALLLPIPAVSGSMTAANLLDTSTSPAMLRNMWSTLHPPTMSAGPGKSIGRSPTVVFHHDIYTVVLAQDAKTIGPALSQVPPERRPAMNPEIFQAYGRWYPGWTFALCCFNAKEESAAKPMLWWYKPRNPEQLFFPALDAHDGHAPDLNAQVEVDHTLLVSSYKMPGRGYFTQVRYTDANVAPELLPYRPSDVIGADMAGSMQNGDFVCDLEDVRRGQFKPRRFTPKG